MANILKDIDWRKTLTAVAPVLASALGGPMAGLAVNMAATALGMPPGATEADLQAAVLGSAPDTLLKLKECENAFTLELERLGIERERLGVERERIEAGDRGSARDMGARTTLYPQMLLSLLFTMGFIVALLTLFSGTEAINPKMMQPAMYLLGILSAGMVQIMNFWLGTSSGSAKKSDTIAKLTTLS